MIHEQDHKRIKTLLFEITARELGGACAKQRLNDIAASLAGFCCDAIRKYADGQIYHGGDIRDRHLKIEAADEFIDLFWYSSAMGWEDLTEEAKRELLNEH